MKAKVFEGVWIPRDVFENDELTLHEKIVYSMIQNLSSDEPCFASNGYFAKILGMSPRRVSSHISKIKAKGYVQVTLLRSKDGTVKKRNITTCHKTFVSTPPTESVHLSTDEQQVDGSVLYIIKDNNKEDNKDIINPKTGNGIVKNEVRLDELFFNWIKSNYPKDKMGVDNGRIKIEIRKAFKKDGEECVVSGTKHVATVNPRFCYRIDRHLKNRCYHTDHPTYPKTTSVYYTSQNLEPVNLKKLD